MDIDHIKNQRNSKANNKDESIAFSQSIGSRMSAMEHLVPEQMFSTESNKAQGISAVKALAIASQQGQKIWTITQSNLELALSRIHLSEGAETDIRNGVNAGKIATAHEAQINFNGWIGEGYTLIDPQTGAGAYMISGGGNGSLVLLAGALLFIIAVLNPGTAIAIAALIGAILLIGCGLSAETHDSRYFDGGLLIVSIILGAISKLDPEGAILMEVFSYALGGAAIFASLGNECAKVN